MQILIQGYMQLMKSSQILTNNTLKKMDELEQKIINLEEENLKLKQGNQELERKIEILHRNISSRSPGYQAKH